jgi:hypothetical protein
VQSERTPGSPQPSSMRARSYEHLQPATPQEAEACVQAVERCFGSAWLTAASPKHGLQKVWQRFDHLATSEIFRLGKSIIELEKRAPEWLKSTARNIRKGGENGHGFLGEILVCGEFAPVGGFLTPADKKQPGFDAVATHADGTTHLISIKRHDRSKHEAEFRMWGYQIRKTFRGRLNLTKSSRALSIVVSRIMQVSDVEEIIRCLKELRDLSGYHKIADGAVELIFSPISWPSAPLARAYSSDRFMLIAREHDKEQLRFEKNIRVAGNKFKNALAMNDPRCRVLYMRIHQAGDMDRLVGFSQQYLDEPADQGLDAIFLIQPCVARTAGASQIHYRVGGAFGRRFSAEAVAGRTYSACIGVGSVSPSKVALALMDGEGRQVGELSDHYVYQRGDLFASMKVDQNGASGEMCNPGDGISVHCVAEFFGSHTLLKGIFPAEDELLVV